MLNAKSASNADKPMITLLKNATKKGISHQWYRTFSPLCRRMATTFIEV